MFLCPAIDNIWELAASCTLLRGGRYTLLLLPLKRSSGWPQTSEEQSSIFTLKQLLQNAGCAPDIQFLNVLCLLEFTDSHSSKYRIYWASQMSVFSSSELHRLWGACYKQRCLNSTLADSEILICRCGSFTFSKLFTDIFFFFGSTGICKIQLSDLAEGSSDVDREWPRQVNRFSFLLNKQKSLLEQGLILIRFSGGAEAPWSLRNTIFNTQKQNRTCFFSRGEVQGSSERERKQHTTEGSC